MATPGEPQLRNLHQLKNFIDDHGFEKEYQSGESVYAEGDHANAVFLVLSGAVKTYKIDEQGKEFITSIFKPDDLFGLTGFAGQVTHKEYAMALEDLRLVKIAKERLMAILENNPELSMELVQHLAENLTEAKEELLQMAYGSVRKKTAHTLIKFAEKLTKKPDDCIHILRSDLAGVAGIATETLIRTLSNFRDEGLISISNRDIYLLDLPRLRRMV